MVATVQIGHILDLTFKTSEWDISSAQYDIGIYYYLLLKNCVLLIIQNILTVTHPPTPFKMSHQRSLF